MDSFSDKKQIEVNGETKEVSTNKDLEMVLFSHKDKNFFFIYQKIKKLSAALYLITNFFEETEPLKNSLRVLATSFLSVSARMYRADSRTLSGMHTNLESLILETLSLLEVASLNGLISPMNLSILKREFSDLTARLHTLVEGSKEEALVLEPQFFITKEAEIPTSIMQRGEAVSTKNVLKESFGSSVKNFDLYKQNQEESIPRVAIESVQDEEKKEKLKDFGSVAVKKNRRQSLIIGLLKRKKEIMIKDVVGLITDCSEKTIQRELSMLVDSGLLKKEGERRWTRYSLVVS